MGSFWASFCPCEARKIREALKNKNCDYSDIVPISYDPLPPEGDRDSKNRDNFDEIGPPSLPAVVGTYKLKIRCLDFDTLYIG